MMRHINKIVIADRSPLYREGLKIALGDERDWQFIEVDCVAGLIELNEQISQFDLIIIDAAFFRPEDKCFMRHFICDTTPPVLFACNQHEVSFLRYAKECGAQGMVPKNSSLGCIKQTVEGIIAGESIWPDSSESLLTHKAMVSEADKVILEQVNTLTPKERVIVPYLMQGKLYKQIAYELGLQDTTVKFHAANIQRKMHSHNRTHLVAVLTKVIPIDSNTVGGIAG